MFPFGPHFPNSDYSTGSCIPLCPSSIARPSCLERDSMACFLSTRHRFDLHRPPHTSVRMWHCLEADEGFWIYSMLPIIFYTGKYWCRIQTIVCSGFKFLHNIARWSPHNMLKAFNDTCHPHEVIQVSPEPLLDQSRRFVWNFVFHNLNPNSWKIVQIFISADSPESPLSNEVW